MRDLTVDYPAQRDALREALAAAVADKLDRYGIYSDGAECVHEVSAASYDGFIAHTNGGFRVLVPCTLRDIECEGMTDFESETLQGYIDRARVDAAEAYIADNPELSELYDADERGLDACDWLHAYFDDMADNWAAKYHSTATLPGIAPAPADDPNIETLREEFWEVLDCWLTEGSTFFYEITVLFYERDHRRNNTGADEIFIFAGINTDFEYGRERGLETAIQRDFKLARLTAPRIQQIVDYMVNKL